MKRNQVLVILVCCLMIITLTACSNNADTNESEVVSTPKTTESEGKQEITSMKVQIGDVTFTATLEKNTATDELTALLREGALVLNLSDYSGFEKVGSLGKSLTTSNKKITTQTGDIVLYNGNQIVLFYGSNSWSYTKLGRIDDLTGWENALGSGDIQVTLSINE